MRPTTKMYLARSAVKRDSRGRYTNEGGGDYRAEGGRGGSMGGSMGGEMRSRGEGMNNRSRSYGDGYGGNQRNEMAYGGEMYEEEPYAGNPAPNYNIPEGRDMEHGQQGASNRRGRMSGENRRIGFQSRAQMGGGERENNVVSMQRGQTARHEQQHQQHKEKEEFTPELAEKWVQQMKNADGTKGPHWNHDQIRQVMQHYNIRDIDPHEFYAVINAMYSDYCAVAKKFGMDSSGFYAELAKAWLQDDDAVEDKTAAYYCYVVEHA